MNLISVVVVTYNSQETVIETLESVKNQTYKKIELIITDDCSQDKTVETIKEWINKNENRFEKIILLNHEKNEGITKNINKGWKKSQGIWIKGIAGDDILLPKCIESNLKFAETNPNINAIFSKMELFKEINGEKYPLGISPSKEKEIFFKKSACEQNRELLINDFNMAPNSFLKKNLLEKIEYADERFKMIEDLPMWLKITEIGEKLYFNPEVLVMYRMGSGISNEMEKLINLNFIPVLEEVYENLVYSKLRGTDKIYEYSMKLDFYFQKKLAKIFANKRTKLSIFLLKLVNLIRINFYKNKFIKIFDK